MRLAELLLAYNKTAKVGVRFEASAAENEAESVHKQLQSIFSKLDIPNAPTPADQSAPPPAGQGASTPRSATPPATPSPAAPPHARPASAPGPSKEPGRAAAAARHDRWCAWRPRCGGAARAQVHRRPQLRYQPAASPHRWSPQCAAARTHVRHAPSRFSLTRPQPRRGPGANRPQAGRMRTGHARDPSR